MGEGGYWGHKTMGEGALLRCACFSKLMTINAFRMLRPIMSFGHKNNYLFFSSIGSGGSDA